MNYPIVEVETRDKVVLHGLFLKAPGSRTALIFIHGTASNFYENYFMKPISESLLRRNISVLSANNRGNEVLKAYPQGGASMGHFEDCVKDIDAWVKFVLSKGYKKIILMGHSLGTENVVFYMSKGALRDNVKSAILLGPADSFGTQMKYSKGKNFLKEAKRMEKSGKGSQFLRSDWLCHAGVLPKSADSYINFFREGSELSKALPLRDRNLEMYRKISVPILVVIGDIEKGKGHEYTVIPIRDALRLLEKENPLAECRQIRNCNHDFDGKETQLAEIIDEFMSRLKKNRTI